MTINIISYLLLLGTGLFLGMFIAKRNISKKIAKVIGKDGGDILETIKSLKEEWQIAQERYDLLTDNLAASIIIRDSEDRIIYCSPFTEVLTGFSTQEIYNSKDDFFKQVASDDDKDIIRRALKIAACGEAFRYRYRFYHKTGILMWAETRTVPIMNSCGEVIATLSITLDVTDAALYQKQVEEKNRDLQDFTYMVSHDLKGPIYTIKGMHGILKEYLDTQINNPETIEAMKHIEQAVSRLEKLVGSVLEYSKLSTKEISTEKVNFKGVLLEVLSDLEPVIKDKEIEILCEESYPDIITNKNALYQILANLIGNAVKYRTENRHTVIKVENTAAINRHQAKITISDNCQGIAAEKLPLIFRPFQRANDKVEGSGIGLASVKKLLEKTSGQITVESEYQKGSTFSLTFRKA